MPDQPSKILGRGVFVRRSSTPRPRHSQSHGMRLVLPSGRWKVSPNRQHLMQRVRQSRCIGSKGLFITPMKSACTSSAFAVVIASKTAPTAVPTASLVFPPDGGLAISTI